MRAHTAAALPRLPRRHQEHEEGERRHASAWAVPGVLGIVYGTYVLWLDSNQGASTPAAALLGLVAAVVMAALCYAVGKAQPRMSAETRGIAYAVVFGLAMGFLVSLTGDSVLKCSAIALASAAGMGIAAFYISYGGREYQKGRGAAGAGKSVERRERAGRHEVAARAGRAEQGER